MKRVMVLLVLAVTLVSAGSAAAYNTLYYNGYWGNDARITYYNLVDDAWTYNKHVGAGRMQVTYLTKSYLNVFCLDVYHTIGQSSWQVEQLAIPPDPNAPDAPPYSTADAIKAFDTYLGNALVDKRWATALQVSLWEITHELNWRSWSAPGDNWAQHAFNSTTWRSTGIFQETGYLDATEVGYANTILQFVYDNPSIGPRPHWYWRPINTSRGQGFMDGEVPEPSSLFLLGGILLGAAGLAWRRRRGE